MQYLRSKKFAEQMTDSLVESLETLGYDVLKSPQAPFRLEVSRHGHELGQFLEFGNCMMEYHSAMNQYRVIFTVDGSRSVVTFLDKVQLINFLESGEGFEIAFADVQHLEIEKRLNKIRSELYFMKF